MKNSLYRSSGLALTAIIGGLALASCGEAPTAAVGDCINSADLSDEGIDQIAAIACEEPHDLEVFHVFELPEGDFPEKSGLDSAAEEQCIPEFEEYVGIDYLESDLWITTIYPSEDTWQRIDDREILCLLETDGDSGSMKGAQI